MLLPLSLFEQFSRRTLKQKQMNMLSDVGCDSDSSLVYGGRVRVCVCA